MKRLALSSG